MKKIGIIFAMDEELEAFKPFVTVLKEYNIFDLKFCEGMLGDNLCILTVCGVGKVNASRATQILIDNMDVFCIINIGVAGALTSSLKVLDIVIGKNLVQHDFDITAFNHEKGYIPNVGVYLESDEYLVRLAEEVREKTNFNVTLGTIASGDIFCTSVAMGEKINRKFGALCVEMEGASIAQTCYLSGIPFLIIRSISDVLSGNNEITYEEFLNISCQQVAKFLKEIILNIK